MTDHLVVDGSNLATEGRSLPSLRQLNEAVTELRREMPDAIVTVVVDATFAHRIDPSELAEFEKGSLEGAYVHPPAGAVGRGDAFLLRIAERVDGIVVSNDSFQEFHGEHPWLFERGRLLGAMPVPGVGWIFVPRNPVRGARSRVAVRDSTRARQKVVRAIAEATKEAVGSPPPRRERAAAPSASESRSPQAVNEPVDFIAFVAEHRLGDEVTATVESFTSHGAVVTAGAVRCYAPLAGLGAPAPKSAREVLRKGETRTFVVAALDPYRRGVELCLPGVAVSGRPSEETVAAEVAMAKRAAGAAKRASATTEDPPPARRRRRGPATSAPDAAEGAEPPPEPSAPPDDGPRRRRQAEPAGGLGTRRRPRAVVVASSETMAEPPPIAPPRRRRLRRGSGETPGSAAS